MPVRAKPSGGGGGWSLQRLLDRWPGKQRFGIFRFLPGFFLLGAALEFTMIKWTVGETNFYKTYKKRQVSNALEYEEFRRKAFGAAQNTNDPK